jgi:hypothetical protein
LTPVTNRPKVSQIWIIYFAFLATFPMFAFVLHTAKPSGGEASLEVLIAIACVAIVDVPIGHFIRKSHFDRARASLRNNDRTTAVNLWLLGNIMGFTFAETVMLFGFVLRILGASWNVVGIFFAAGFLLLLLWRPRPDLITSPDTAPSSL